MSWVCAVGEVRYRAGGRQCIVNGLHWPASIDVRKGEAQHDEDTRLLAQSLIDVGATPEEAAEACRPWIVGESPAEFETRWHREPIVLPFPPQD